MSADEKQYPQGKAMHDLMRRLFPIYRSLTGDGVRETFAILREHMDIETYEVPSGTEAFDWTVPEEWVVRQAYVEDSSGKRVIDMADNNLHLMGYSTPVDDTFSLEQLQPHLHFHPELHDAIPYVTSYYSRNWGFCLSKDQYDSLPEDEYHVVIDTELKKGHMTYGDLVIPGETDEEILLSTYICHPSLANNELSGPMLATWLSKWVRSKPRRYTYRFVFVPEAIGAITYLSTRLEELKDKVRAGFVLTCIGDERAWSYLPSRYGNNLADRAAQAVLHERHPEFIRYSYLHRGSDERQYCSPGVDLPVCSVMRSKYECYPEYHTSRDDLTLVTPKGLQESYDTMAAILELLEGNRKYRVICPCEPQMGKRGLYPSISSEANAKWVKDMMSFLAYTDGTNDLIKIAEIVGLVPTQALALAEKLEQLLEVSD